MTRKSKREIERELESLGTNEEGSGILFIYTNEAGEEVDADGNPITEEQLDRAKVIFDLKSVPKHYDPDE